MTPRELRVDTAALANEGNGLVGAASDIPAPPDQFTATGTDPLSSALSAQIQAAVAPLIEGLPKTKADATRVAQQVIQAAQAYEAGDKQAANDILRHTFDSPDSGSGAGGGGGAPAAAGSGGGSGGGIGGGPGASASTGAAPAGAASAASPAGAGQMGGLGEIGQLGQMMSMPMEMASQAGQAPMGMMGMAGMIPGAVMQGVQGAMQHASQGGQQSGAEPPGGQGHDAPTDATQPPKDTEVPAEKSDEGAAPQHPHAERVPDSAQQPPAAEPAPPAHTRPPEPEKYSVL